MLTVIDEFTRRCMAVVVERRLNSDNVLQGTSKNSPFSGVVDLESG